MKRFLLVALLSMTAVARQPMPLMPERDVAPRAYASSRTRTQSEYSAKTSARASDTDPMILGIELGAVGKASATKSDFAGMQALLGGRFFLRMPVLFENWYLKPSLGYFNRTENQGIVGITQHSFEGGLVVQYALSNRNKFKWMVGLSQRMEALLSRISVGRVDGGGDPDLIYRLGPTTGFGFSVGRNVEMVIDAEVGFALVTPRQTYTGLTMGLAFGL